MEADKEPVAKIARVKDPNNTNECCISTLHHKPNNQYNKQYIYNV